jgi:hypothetical protein
MDWARKRLRIQPIVMLDNLRKVPTGQIADGTIRPDGINIVIKL